MHRTDALTPSCVCGGTPTLEIERETLLGTEVAAEISCTACGRRTGMVPVWRLGDLSPTADAWAALQDNIHAGAGI